MRRVQKFIGVSDSKPASAPIQIPAADTAVANSLNPLTGYVPNSSHLLPPPSGSASATLYQYSTSPASIKAASNPPSPSLQHHDTKTNGNSATPSLQYFDIPPTYRSSGTPTPVSPIFAPTFLHNQAVSPSAAAAVTTPVASTSHPDSLVIERQDLHKTLKALESLLINLDEYRDLAAKLAKVEKKLSKSAAELVKIKSVKHVPSQTLSVSASMLDALHDVSSKHARLIQKEYEALNDSCAKYFKKVAKEERAHDELIESLDAKIKKANAAHEKNIKRNNTSKAVESHDKYIATVQALASDMSKAKASHSASMGVKSHVATLMAATTLGGLADNEFRSHCESVRKLGPFVGKLNEWLCFTTSDAMPAMQPLDLDENQQGHAQFLANVQNQVEARANAQTEAQIRALDDVQAALRAQQMGWRPPSQASHRQSAISLADFPRLDSNGHLLLDDQLQVEPQDAASSRTSTELHSIRSQPLAEKDTQSIRSSVSIDKQQRQQPQEQVQPPPQQPQSPPPRRSTSPPAQLQQQQRQQQQQQQQQQPSTSQPPSSPRQDTKDTIQGHPSSSNAPKYSQDSSPSQHVRPSISNRIDSFRLDRSPTGSSVKSMLAQAKDWEDNSAVSRGTPRESSVNVGPSTVRESKVELEAKAAEDEAKSVEKKRGSPSLHQRQDSSGKQSTRNDRLILPPEGSESSSIPSLSNSNGAASSEEGAKIPRTPRKSESLSGRVVDKEQEQKGSGPSLDGQYIGAVASTLVQTESTKRLAERALDRYRDLGRDPGSRPRYPGLSRDVFDGDDIYTHSPAGLDGQDEHSRTRKLSLWERERERERQLERDMELQRRLIEEQQLRNDAYGSYSSSSISSRPLVGSAMYGMQSRSSEVTPNDRGSSYSRHGADMAAARENYDPGRYVPAVGTSRISGVSVSRSLSTDTTASERSFVSRMKARYQVEKELEREISALEKERITKRMVTSPADMPSMGSRRVTEIASKYQSFDRSVSGGPGYPIETTVGRRYQEAMAASYGNSPVRGVRSSMPPPPRQVIEEGSHSEVCGCHGCSIRHYGSGSTAEDRTGRGANTTQNQDSRQPQPLDSRDFTARRQTMPLSPINTVSNARELYPPQNSSSNYFRRSFEDLNGPGDRKVMFAHSPTIR